MGKILSGVCRSILVLLVSVSGHALAGVGDGPRAYQVAPVGSQRLSIMPIHQNSSFHIDGSPSEPSARIKADILAMQYTHILDVGGNTTGLFAVVPYADISAKLLDTKRETGASGVGDLVVGAIFGLTGASAMTPKEFAAYKPGFTAGLLTKLTLPTGRYDEDNLLNIGTNRWAVQLGGAFSWYFGESLTAGNNTSIELTPAVTFYGDNDSPRNADKMEQRPVYTLEANATHDFSSRYWGSIDALYSIGGATETDGVKSQSDTEKFLLGATVGMYLPHGYGLQLNYGKTLKVDSDGYKDHLIRIKLSKSF
ncbi:transporter [Parendozoicomonas sp. Alg238-R29]|uniref:transporter n=1 Tax=Parendozoicomonas sp. Alg238-R29 TaxID=2993446 RepID=UPI00248DD9F1|nr:transporter [Parendozoicomonas sp. Alg238-R29]